MTAFLADASGAAIKQTPYCPHKAGCASKVPEAKLAWSPRAAGPRLLICYLHLSGSKLPSYGSRTNTGSIPEKVWYNRQMAHAKEG